MTTKFCRSLLTATLAGALDRVVASVARSLGLDHSVNKIFFSFWGLTVVEGNQTITIFSSADRSHLTVLNESEGSSSSVGSVKLRSKFLHII